MDITKIDPPARRKPFNWSKVAATCRAEPGQWFLVRKHPKVTRHGVQHGSPQAFLPAGSFDARVAKDGLQVVFLGEPIAAWDPYGLLGRGEDSRKFDELERADAPTV